MCSRWRSPLLLAGMRVRAAAECCDKPPIQKPAIQLWPQGASDLGSPHDGELGGKSNMPDRSDHHPIGSCGAAIRPAVQATTT